MFEKPKRQFIGIHWICKQKLSRLSCSKLSYCVLIGWVRKREHAETMMNTL